LSVDRPGRKEEYAEETAFYCTFPCLNMATNERDDNNFVGSEPQSVFSAHWHELAAQLSDRSAKSAILDHLERAKELAATPAGPHIDNTNTSSDVSVASIKEAHARRISASDGGCGIVDDDNTPVSARSELTEDNDSPRGSSKTELTSKNNQDYSKLDYWEQRFEEEEYYDWLLTFDQLKPQLLPLLQPYGHNAKILLVGVGNSSFSADLYDEGYTNLVNMDYSSIVIEKMKAKHEVLRPRMKWEVADMTTMSFEQHTPFDIVIDKAALDALMVDEGSVWDPCESVITAADKTCQCVRKMFKEKGAIRAITCASSDGSSPSVNAVATAVDDNGASSSPLSPLALLPGLYVMISFMQPHFRTKYLMGIHADRTEGLRTDRHDAISPYSACKGYCERYDWDMDWKTITVNTGSFEHYLYIMRTRPTEDTEVAMVDK
jgi:EEF1A lysine methyltransferase 4